MNEKIFIRTCMLYEFDRGHSPSEAAHNIQKTYGIQRVSACSSLLSQLNRVGFSRFWDSFVTSDEKWIVYDNSGNQNQWLDRDRKSTRLNSSH